VGVADAARTDRNRRFIVNLAIICLTHGNGLLQPFMSLPKGMMTRAEQWPSCLYIKPPQRPSDLL
jgi:hypothetical protein